MFKIIFQNKAEKQFGKFSKNVQKMIIDKLYFYSSQKDPLQFAKKLISPEIGTYRFRIGDYRVIFDLDEKGRIIIIALIGHRKEIYK